MDPETLKALVEVLSNVSGDARDVIVMFLAARLAEALLVVGCIFGSIWIVMKTLYKIIKHCSLVKQFQHDLGYGGELLHSERQHIIDVWRAGMKTDAVKK